MNDEQLLRYSKHLLLPSIDYEGQEALCAAHVAIIGVGGLGCSAAQYLAGSGIGHITIIDHDQIELSNLQRQILYPTADIGEAKVVIASRQLLALNPNITVHSYAERISEALFARACADVDLVVDCSDNFATRFFLNKLCVAKHKPLLSGAAIGFDGQCALFTGYLPDSPCYRCLYDEQDYHQDTPCSEQGILAPLVGVVGSVLAVETIKFLLGVGKNISGQLLVINSYQQQWRKVTISVDRNCPVCS